MSTNGINSAEDVDTSECDGEKVVTMMDVLQEQEEFEEDANAVLGASDDKNCTYPKGYIKRQAIYACLTCCDEARSDPSKRAGVCLACSLTCHENHELIELYTKRNFRCDCGNPKFNSHPCQFMSNKTELNEDNQYNQNFSGLYCICHRPYPDPENPIEDEMIQCIICEDWLHSAHLEAVVPTNEQYAEMICKECMNKNEFLHDYSDFAVNTESIEVDIITNNDTGVTTTDVSDCNKSQNPVLLNGSTVSSEINNDEQNKEVMDVGSTLSLEINNDQQNKEVMDVGSTLSSEINNDEQNKEAMDVGSTLSSEINNDEQNKEVMDVGNTLSSEINNDEQNKEVMDVGSTLSSEIDNDEQNKKVTDVGSTFSSEINNDEQNKELMDVSSTLSSKINNDEQNTVMDVDSSIKETNNEIASKNSIAEANEENVNDKKESSDKTPPSQETCLAADNIDETITSDTDNTVRLDAINREVDAKLTEPETIQVSNEKPSSNESAENLSDNIITDNNESEQNKYESSNLSSEFDSNTVSVNDIEQIKKATPGNLLETEVENSKETEEVASNKSKDDGKEQTHFSHTNENIDMETCEVKAKSPEKSVSDSMDETILDSTDNSKFNSVNKSETVIESNKANEENMESTEPTSTENVDIEMKDDNVTDKVDASDIKSDSVSILVANEVATDKEEETKSAAIESINVSEAESLLTKNEDKLISESAAQSGTESEVQDNETADQSSDKTQDLENSQILPNIQENKRKLSTEESDAEVNMPKKAKLEDSKQCVKPKQIEKRFKGATFWPSNFRQKLCTCNECILMYKDLSVLFLIDPEDTVTAYETLGKEKINGAPVSQYEKGLEALSSLDRIQQINALTEYNKMRDKLLDFLKSFKDRKEIVKEEDIKAFFAGMKPKREPDGVYFCR